MSPKILKPGKAQNAHVWRQRVASPSGVLPKAYRVAANPNGHGVRSQAASLKLAQEQFTALARNIRRIEMRLEKAQASGDTGKVKTLLVLLHESQTKASLLVDQIAAGYVAVQDTDPRRKGFHWRNNNG